MFLPRAGLGLALGALLTGTLVINAGTTRGEVAQESALAAEQGVTNYTMQIKPSRRGPTIPETMYGVFYEDINHAADGGLYAELVQNRSFEYAPVDNPSYTHMTAWNPTSTGGATGTAQVVNDGERLNKRNRNYLRLGLDGNGGENGRYGVVNTGYNSGIVVRPGKKYDFSVWARTDQPSGTPLTVALRDASSGEALAQPLQLTIRGDEWTQYSGTFVATTSNSTGRLAVTAGGAGAVRLDMVSLFPRDTYKGRDNGLREDLAKKIAALKPAFLRFPGGCIVNIGSHEAYQAPDWERQRSYQWKDTIGPIETRATNHNFWGYNQSYGLGYYELFLLAEDIGAMPVPVVPALVTGCGQNQATEDPQLLQRHIQDTLDLIEFANGPVTSEWGNVRARMGHPEPFGLTRIEVGNEENLPEEFFERFLKFRKVIKEKYPDITVISNSGPDDSGPNFERLWELNRRAGVQMVDEHYYNSPEWFLENNRRYDSYDRNGPKVFLGEYASQGNRFYNALAEAAFMAGLERNADIVKMASYAPLLANEDYVDWRPDLIWFNNKESWGSANYQVQKLFMNNVGDHVVPSEASSTPDQPQPPITGAIGLSTWATSAAYDNVTATSADGRTLLQDDFSGDASQWTHLTGRGSWSIQDGAYVQSDTEALNTMVTAGDRSWSNYDLHVTATKRSGREGFLIAFGVRDTGNYYWWNLGGWNNTRSAVEKATDGAKQTLIQDDTTIETGREYDIRIKVRGRQVTLFLDGKKWGSFTDKDTTEPFRQVVTRDTSTGELIVKLVNAQENAARTRIDLGDEVEVVPAARVTTLQGDPDAVNTASAQPIKPRRSTFHGVDNTFTYTFPAYSVSFMRIKTRPPR